MVGAPTWRKGVAYILGLAVCATFIFAALAYPTRADRSRSGGLMNSVRAGIRAISLGGEADPVRRVSAIQGKSARAYAREMEQRRRQPELLQWSGMAYDPREDEGIPEGALPELIAARARVPDALLGSAGGDLDYWICQYDGQAGPYIQALQKDGVETVGFIPNAAYLVRATPEQIAAIQGIRDTRWVGRVLPIHKLDGGFLSALAMGDDTSQMPVDSRGMLQAQIDLYTGIGSAAYEPIVKNLPGVEILNVRPADASRGGFIVAINPSDMKSALVELAGLRDVSAITLSPPPRPSNDQSVWQLQSGLQSPGATNYDLSAPLFARGITGRGMIGAVVDDGLENDLCQFRYTNTVDDTGWQLGPTHDAADPVSPEVLNGVTGTGIRTRHRKLVAYYLQRNAAAYSSSIQHGTTVSSCMLGDNNTVLAARPLIRDLGQEQDVRPYDVTPAWNTAGDWVVGQELRPELSPQVDDPLTDTFPLPNTYATNIEHHQSRDGMAPGAQLIIQDIGDPDGGLVGTFHELLLHQAHSSSATVTNHSYGQAPCLDCYVGQPFDIDDALWARRDLVTFVAASNDGLLGAASIGGGPSQSKSAIVVGASERGDAASCNGTPCNPATSFQGNDMADFSSRGPKSGGLLAPEIAVPGIVISAAAGGIAVNPEDGTGSGDGGCGSTLNAGETGTSFASPTAAGLGLLVQQYFQDGYYPSGVPTATDRMRPTNALVRAVLVNSTRDMLGGRTDDSGTTQAHRPSMGQGWGLPRLDDTLYFQGDPVNVGADPNFHTQRARFAVLTDTPNGFDGSGALTPEPGGKTRDQLVKNFQRAITDGAVHEFVVNVVNDDPNSLRNELRVTMAYSDSVGGSRSAPTVNDLDLEVIGPGPDGVLASSSGANLLGDDQVFRTNPLSAAWDLGFSVPSTVPRLQATRAPFDATLPDKDSLNTVENVFIKASDVYPGQYRIRVIGYAVPGGAGTQGARPNFVLNDRPPIFDTDGDGTNDTDFEDAMNSTDQGYALLLSGNFTATQGLISLNQATFGCSGEILTMTLSDENGDAAPGPGCAGGIEAVLTTTTPAPSFPADRENVSFTGSQPTYRSLNPATGTDGFEVRLVTDPGDVVHGDGIIQIVHGETIQARYVDQNPCGGEAFAQASVGCQPAIDDSGFSIEDGCDYCVSGDPASGVCPDQFMDRGEIARYTVFFVNNGADDLHDVRVSLVPDPADPVSAYVHVLDSPQVVGLAPPGRRANATFLVQIDATTSVPAQHQLDFIIEISAPVDGLLYPDTFTQSHVLESDIEEHRYDTRDPNGELFGFDRYRRLRRGVEEASPPPNPPQDYETNDPNWFDPDVAGAAGCAVARNLWPNRNQPPAGCPVGTWTGNDWDPWDFDDSNEGFQEFAFDGDDVVVGVNTPFLFNYANAPVGGGCGWEDQVHDEIATHGNPLPAGHPDLFTQPWGIWHTGAIGTVRQGPFTPTFPGSQVNEGAPFFENPSLGDRDPNDHTIKWNSTSAGGSDNSLGQWCDSYYDVINQGQYYRSMLISPRLFRVHRANPEYKVEFDELRFFSRMDGHTRNDDNWVAAGWFVNNQPVDPTTPGPPPLYSWGQFQYGTNIYTDKTAERWAVDDNDFTINLRAPNSDFPDLTYEDIFGPAADQWNFSFGWTQVHFTGKKGNGQYGWGIDDVSFVWRETREVADQSDCAALVPAGPPATLTFAEQRYNACEGTFEITLIDQTQTLPQVAVSVTSEAENFEIAILRRQPNGRYEGTMAFTTDDRNDAVGVLKVSAGLADIGQGASVATVEYDPDEAAIAGPTTLAEAAALADWEDLDGNGINDDDDGDGTPNAEDDLGRERIDQTVINCTSGRLFYIKHRLQQAGATGDGDRFADHGERMLMAVSLVSSVGADLDDVTVRISTDDPIHIVNDTVNLDTLPGNQTVTETPLEFEFCVPPGFKTTDVANPRTITFRIDVSGTNTANLNAFSTAGDSYNTWLPLQAILLADVDEVPTPIDYDDNRAPTRTGRPIGTYYEAFEGAAAGANGLDHPFIASTEPGTPAAILQDTTTDTRFGMAGNGGFCPECDFQTDCAVPSACAYQFSNDATNGYPSTLAGGLEWSLTQAPSGWAYRGVGAYKFGDPSSNASQQEQHYSKGQYISLQLPPLRISNDPTVTPEMSWWQIVDMWPPNFTSGLLTTIDGCVIEIAPSTIGVGDSGTGADRRNRATTALISPTSPTTRYPLSNYRRVSPYTGVYDYETDVLNACRALFCAYKHPVFSVIGSPEATPTDEHAGTPGTPGAWYESKIDLSDFRGQEIVIQFSAEVMQDLDIQPGSIGWFIDEVRVTGVSNRIGIRAQANQITNDQCGLQAGFAAPSPACFGSEVQFLDRHEGVGLFDPSGNPYPIQYEWTIGTLSIPRGDAGVLINPPIAGVFGTYDNPRVNLQQAAGAAAPGTVSVEMRVYQNGALIDSQLGSVIYKDAPVPVITAAPNPGLIDGVTRFTADVTVGALDPNRTYVYEWNFGDGSPVDASGPAVSHVFTSQDSDPGTAGNQPFPVTVSVYDEDGCVGTTTLNLTVNASPRFGSPTATFVDDCAGGGPTDDGNADLNEYITMNLGFRNTSATTPAVGVVGYLSSPDVLVEITGDAALFGDVAASAVSPARPYTFIRRDDGTGASSCLVIPFQLTLVSNSGSVIQVLDFAYTMGNAAEVTHAAPAAGPQSFCFQDPTDPDNTGITKFFITAPANGCLDGLEMRMTLTSTARALIDAISVEIETPEFTRVTVLPAGYGPNTRGPYVLDFSFGNDASGPVGDTGGVVLDNSGAANTLEDQIQADLPSQLLGTPMVGSQPWTVIVRTTSPGTCPDGTWSATLNTFDLEGNSSGDLEVATEPACGSCITGSTPVFNGARSDCGGTRVLFNPAVDTSSCNGVSDVTYQLYASLVAGQLGNRIDGTASEHATLDCASYPDGRHAATRLSDATWWDVCDVETVYWTVIAVDAAGQRYPNISAATDPVPAGYQTSLLNCAIPISEGQFAIVKGTGNQATLWLVPPTGIPTWGSMSPPVNAVDYRLLRGTFPSSGGLLKTLGFRINPAGNNCAAAPAGAACRDAAYDHNAVACSFSTTQRDLSADMAAPGSFYYLVPGTNSGGCYGMGYRATPGGSAGTLSRVEEIPGFGPAVTPNPACPIPCDSP